MQVLKGGEKYKFEHPNPFITEEEEGEVASVAYRYRKWDLGNDIVCIIPDLHSNVLKIFD